MPDAKEGPRESMGDEEKKINNSSDNVHHFDVKQNFCNISRDLHIYIYIYVRTRAVGSKPMTSKCLIKKNPDKNWEENSWNFDCSYVFFWVFTSRSLLQLLLSAP